jgi:HTH-type transcriptional regulator/antitoxin MqsA
MNTMIDCCPICSEGPIHEITRDRRLNINGNSISVPDDIITKCDHCGELFYTGSQAKVSDRRLADARRRQEGLLTSADIRRYRQSLELSQTQLESALGVGPKTVVRWENGTAVQSKALDDVLRLIALDPDNLRLLVHIRHAALATHVEQKLTPQDLSKSAELRTAVYATLERFRTVSEEDTARVADAIVSALRAYKREKIKKIATEARAAIAI